MLEHEAPGCAVMHHPDHRHADFIKDMAWQAEVVGAIARMARAGCSGLRSGSPTAGSPRRSARVRQQSPSPVPVGGSTNVSPLYGLPPVAPSQATFSAAAAVVAAAAKERPQRAASRGRASRAGSADSAEGAAYASPAPNTTPGRPRSASRGRAVRGGSGAAAAATNTAGAFMSPSKHARTDSASSWDALQGQAGKVPEANTPRLQMQLRPRPNRLSGR